MPEETSDSAPDQKSIRVAEIREMARAGIASARARDFENGYLVLGEVCDRLRQSGEKLPAPVISYYGLCVALHRGKHREGLELCQAAIDAEPMKAEYYTNLAEVCAAGRQRRKAMTALQRGLALEPGNARLLDLEIRLGRRRDPVVSSLGREHPVNVTLGRIRHALAGPPRLPKRPARPKKSE
jgi:hypothetical protein